MKGRYAYVALLAVSAALSVSALLGAVAYYHSSQASQRRQDTLIEARLCATLGPLAGLAALSPPAGNPDSNPARAFEQQLVVKLAPLAQLGPDLGCDKEKR